MDYKKKLMDLLDNSLAIFATEMLGVSGVLLSPNDSELMRYGKQGILWTAISEIIDFLRTGNNFITQGNYYYLADDAFFNTAAWVILSKSGLAVRVSSIVENAIPLGNPQISDAIASGVVKLSAKFVQTMISDNWMNTPLNRLVHVTSLLQ